MLVLAALILLPIVPAYLLFSALPGRAAITGPLKGFKINLSGAFAGYFALLLLLIASHDIWKPEAKILAKKWTVKGRVVDSRNLPIQPLDVTNVSLSPPAFMPAADGNFRLEFMPTPSEDGDTFVYPDLVITSGGYMSKTIPLDPQHWGQIPLSIRKRWEKTRVIELSEIKLDILPPYQPDPGSIQPDAGAPWPGSRGPGLRGGIFNGASGTGSDSTPAIPVGPYRI